MRPATKSEKFLLGLLGLVIVGGGLFLGGSALLERQAVLDRQRKLLQADQLEAMVALQSLPLSTNRQQWLHDHEPLMGEASDTQAQVLNFVIKGARDHHLEINEQNLGAVQHGFGGAKLSAEIKVKGTMEALCRWLAELQQPQNFYSIDSFTLKADPDQKSVVCELHISRSFRENGS